MARLLVLCCSLFTLTTATYDFHWKISKNISIIGLTKECKKDVLKWIEAIEEFNKELSQCAADVKNCSESELEKNFNSLRQLDAFGRLPSGLLEGTFISFGSPEECQSVSENFFYKTKFCYANGVLGKENCEKKEVKYFKKAVCMPKMCTERDILLLMNEIQSLPIEYCSLDCIPENGEINTFFWFFISFLILLFIITLVSTIFDYVQQHYGQFKGTNSKVINILSSFSFYTNGSSILDTHSPKEGHLKSLDCIRFFSMIWVVSGHLTGMWIYNDSLAPLTKLTQPLLSDTVANAFFSVDTFFVLSGILVSYMFFKTILKNKKLIKNPATWILFYAHRYLRLTPPYILFVFFFMAIVPLFMGVNSVDYDYMGFVDKCRKYWWRNLLYINNLDHDQSCYPVTWYLAADTQMYIFSPVVLVGLDYSESFGLLIIIVSTIGSMSITFYEVYHYDLPASVVRLKNAELFAQHLYTKPWIRVTPYLIGLYVGYFLAKYGLSKKPNISLAVILLGWILFPSIALACIYGPHSYLAFHDDWSKFWRSFYYSFSRIGWGLFVSWVIIANYYGWGGPIASFMEHPLWQPLGRLSYSAYLVHMFVIMYFVDLSDRPIHFTSIWQQFLYYVVPIVVISYFLAFVWSCLCEIPFLKLEKFAIDAIIGKRSKKEELCDENKG